MLSSYLAGEDFSFIKTIVTQHRIKVCNSLAGHYLFAYWFVILLLDATETKWKPQLLMKVLLDRSNK